MPPPAILGMLFLAGLVAGMMNGLAGGGSFVGYPAMLLAGVAPVPANASNSMALWPGSAASAFAYRSELRGRRGLVVLSLVSLAGGVAGAVLLLHTPNSLFRRLVPFLVLLATVLFAVGGRLAVDRPRPPARTWALALAQLPIAVYGGYFGGGIGIMQLAAFTYLGMGDYHEVNSVKTLLSTWIATFANLTFLVAGAISWPHALPALVGAVAGGYLSIRIARRLPPRPVRMVVIGIGLAVTVALFVKQ